MTAFAFILGVVPLMLASGAGAGAQNVMGTAVFWGMLVATALGVFLIPGNFAFVEGLGRKRNRSRPRLLWRHQPRERIDMTRDVFLLPSLRVLAAYANFLLALVIEAVFEKLTLTTKITKARFEYLYS